MFFSAFLPTFNYDLHRALPINPSGIIWSSWVSPHILLFSVWGFLQATAPPFPLYNCPSFPRSSFSLTHFPLFSCPSCYLFLFFHPIRPYTSFYIYGFLLCCVSVMQSKTNYTKTLYIQSVGPKYLEGIIFKTNRGVGLYFTAISNRVITSSGGCNTLFSHAENHTYYQSLNWASFFSAW